MNVRDDENMEQERESTYTAVYSEPTTPLSHEDVTPEDQSLADERRSLPVSHRESDPVSQTLLSENTEPARLCSEKSAQKTNSSHRKKTDQRVQNFMDVCSAICKWIEKISSNSTLSDCDVTATLQKTVQQTRCILNDKEVCISMLGMHNSGKSTLLNVLIGHGEKFLPVLAFNETSVKVKIQHDEGVHMGVCPKNCQEENYACCPRLIVQSKDKQSEVCGPHRIYERLRELNREIRSAQSTLSPELLTVTLKVNLPLLSESVPPGWTVSIIDNPGFGEVNEHIAQLAEASMVTSSAYIYLILTENVEGRQTVDFFRELKKRDEKAFGDGRLTIGISKYDTNYDSYDEENVTMKMVKEKVADTIKRVVNEHVTVSDDMIIPLCGKWALASSKLGSCLISDPRKEKIEWFKKAIEKLQCFPGVSLPSGQGQDHTETIMKIYTPEKVVEETEAKSGISDLKTRISCVGRTCVKVWATKLHTTLHNILSDLKEPVENCEARKLELRQTKEKDLTVSRGLLNDIDSKTKGLQHNIKSGRVRTSTDVWKSFEETYAKDLKESNPQETGKEKARTLIAGFKETCRQKIEQRKFGPREFETCLKEFLDESAKRLQMVFDTNCGFWNSCNYLMKQIEYVFEEISLMNESAIKLLHSTSETNLNMKESDKVGDCNHAKKKPAMRKPLKLGDIKQKVPIPGVSLPWWRIIMQFFRGLLSKSEVETSPIAQVDRVINGSNTCHSENAEKIREPGNEAIVLPHEPDGESDMHDDSTWQESSEIYLDIDDVDRHRDPEQLSENIYRCWTPELEKTLEKVQMYMEEACDKYFKEIEYKAIEYFYQEYYHKTSKHLNKYNVKFEESLRKERQRQQKLKEEIISLCEELEYLRKTKEKRSESEQQLIEEYEKFTIEHCTECQPLQERSYHDYFELARKRDEAIRSCAHLMEFATI